MSSSISSSSLVRQRGGGGGSSSPSSSAVELLPKKSAAAAGDDDELLANSPDDQQLAEGGGSGIRIRRRRRRIGGGGGGGVSAETVLRGTANLANLLPTGTLLAFQILTPIFTNNGACDSVTRLLNLILLILLGLSCFIASFTDTVVVDGGRRVYHGLATLKGIWLFDVTVDDQDPSSSGIDLSKYRIRLIDWVHAFLSLLVFTAVALRDNNVLSCYYPAQDINKTTTREVLRIVPLGIGLLSSMLFIVFPTTRHGIGFPLTPTAPPPK